MEQTQDKLAQLEHFKQCYQKRLSTDPTFRQKMNERSLVRYYKLKALRTETPKIGRPKKIKTEPEQPKQPVIKKRGGRPRKYDIISN